MPAKILVIDDDLSMTELIATALRSRGYEIATANSGEEGLVKLDLISPDAVLLDLIMHGRDGWDICKTIRAAHNSLPIIILSALEDSGTISAALDAGADDYLAKPISISVLVARINRLIRRAISERKAIHPGENFESLKDAFQG